MSSLTSVCVLFAAASVCGGTLEPVQVGGDRLTSDDYAVYSAIMRETVCTDIPREVWILGTADLDLLERFFAVRPKKGTLSWEYMTLKERSEEIMRRLPGLLQSTVADYLSANGRWANFNRRFDLPKAYKLIGERDRERHRSLFRSHRASKLVRLSRVGFDPEHRQALVFMSLSGGTDSETTYFLVRKTQSGWKIAERFAT